MTSVTENPDDVVWQKNMEFLKTLAPTVAYLAVLIVAGLVGNSIVFLVYYKRFKPSVIRTYILAMSVCDFLINSFAIPMQIVEIIFNATFYYGLACKVTRTMNVFLIVLSAGILVAMSVDRQKTIRRLQASFHYDRSGAKRAVAICAVVAFCLALPYGFLTGNQTRVLPGTNVTGVMCSIRDEYKQSTFVVSYNAVSFIAYVACVLVMSVSYGLIAHHLWKHKNETISLRRSMRSQSTRSTEMGTPLTESTQSSNSSGQTKEIPWHTTLMLFVLTVVFVLNYLPYQIVACLDAVAREMVRRVLQINVRYICLRSQYINSAVNPVVYAFCSRRFRLECRQIICGRKQA
ncbi:cholecystokinin receptor type A-like [Littorina saxatilis]|uniref:cholecystokinin receptor type A-like n=1 Tax=Littorina saxatilis TaxID=31220 RepID=UPI0038B5DF6C